jgi:hypothetical protein
MSGRVRQSSNNVELNVAEKMFIAKIRSYGVVTMEDARVIHDACVGYGKGRTIFSLFQFYCLVSSTNSLNPF